MFANFMQRIQEFHAKVAQPQERVKTAAIALAKSLQLPPAEVERIDLMAPSIVTELATSNMEPLAQLMHDCPDAPEDETEVKALILQYVDKLHQQDPTTVLSQEHLARSAIDYKEVWTKANELYLALAFIGNSIPIAP